MLTVAVPDRSDTSDMLDIENGEDDFGDGGAGEDDFGDEGEGENDFGDEGEGAASYYPRLNLLT